MGKGTGYEDLPFVADFYDHIYGDRMARRDVQFFVEYSRRAGGRTLELGCGTGRVLILTAVAGCDITGLDISPFMLDKCREKLSQQPQEVQARVRLVPGDMTDFDVGERFALMTTPFRPFQHLITIEEQKACLMCVREHLEPDGKFILDVYNPSEFALRDPRYSMEIETDPWQDLPDGRRMRRTTRIVGVHRAAQTFDIELIHYVKHADGKEERLVHAFPFRYFYRYEVEHLLAVCGFRVVEMFGDYDCSPFVDESPEMVFVAEKA